MTYTYEKLELVDPPARFPIRILSEIDEDRWEVRKVEYFADGRIGAASEAFDLHDTGLSETPIPWSEDIPGDPSVRTASVTLEEFERAWSEARSLLLYRTTRSLNVDARGSVRTVVELDADRLEVRRIHVQSDGTLDFDSAPYGGGDWLRTRQRWPADEVLATHAAMVLEAISADEFEELWGRAVQSSDRHSRRG